MKITLAQINPQPGNLKANSLKIIDIIKKAGSEGSDLVVFPELCVTGYPPLDLLTYSGFIEETYNAVKTITAECKTTAVILGAPTYNTANRGKPLFNSALLIQTGKVETEFHKALLPTYDVFDEYRYFEPSKKFEVVNFMGVRLAVTICEDLWDDQPFLHEKDQRSIYGVSPMEELKRMNPDMVINISASPFAHNRLSTRELVFSDKAARYNVPVVMVNQTGANADLIFDGGSLIIDRNGKIVTRLPLFEETYLTVDTEEIFKSKNKVQPLPGKVELIHKALLTGIRDYVAKTSQTGVVIGLSGGIDSAVCACLAAEAIGSENVTGILMPSRFSSDHSVKDALELSSNLGIRAFITEIEAPFSGFEKVLAPLFGNMSPDIAEENIQARIRATILMAFANKHHKIVLNTSNKSEAATGYGTLYGDMAGAISVLGDVYKTEVYRLALYINREKPIIPESTITKPPSAELRANQLDTDSLPPYDILDKILFSFIELQEDAEKIISEGYDPDLVRRIISMVNRSEYKRFQAPPCLRVSAKAFGSGRRISLVSG
jgi:NAD+ synthase (glutamine-hydrolysing)